MAQPVSDFAENSIDTRKSFGHTEQEAQHTCWHACCILAPDEPKVVKWQLNSHSHRSL